MKASELVVGRSRPDDSPSIILGARVQSTLGGLASWRGTAGVGVGEAAPIDGGQAVLCRRSASSVAVRDLILPLNICPVIGLIFRWTAASAGWIAADDDDGDSSSTVDITPTSFWRRNLVGRLVAARLAIEWPEAEVVIHD